MYIAVCEDISPNHQTVQACHAAIAAGRDLIRIEQPYLVVLAVPNAAELVQLSCALSSAGVEHRCFFEEDMGGRLTALATGVVTKEQRKLFRDLPLLGKVVGQVSERLERERQAL